MTHLPVITLISDIGCSDIAMRTMGVNHDMHRLQGQVHPVTAPAVPAAAQATSSGWATVNGNEMGT